MTQGGPAECGQGAICSEKHTKHIKTWDVQVVNVVLDIKVDIEISLKKKTVKPCTLNSMALWLTSAPKG